MARGLIGKFIRGAAPVMSQALLEQHKANILAERDKRLAELKAKFNASKKQKTESFLITDEKTGEKRIVTGSFDPSAGSLETVTSPVPGTIISETTGETAEQATERKIREAGGTTQAKKDVELEMDPSITREKEKQKVLGKAEGEKEVQEPKERAKLESTLRKMDRLIGPEQTDKEGKPKPSTIDKAIEQAEGLFSTGFSGSIASSVPGTDAYNLKRTLLTLKANLGFDVLQEMRDNSPTGGALGQVAVQELDSLQSTVGNLDIGQDDDQLIENLKLIRDHYSGYRDAVKASFSERYGSPESGARGGGADQQSRSAPNGSKKYEDMSMEEKIKFLEQKTKLK